MQPPLLPPGDFVRRAAPVLVAVAASALLFGTAAAETEGKRSVSTWFAVDPAGIGPLGVPDAYALREGEFGFSYRYSVIHSDDLRNDTHRVSTLETLQTYEQAPRQRDEQVHMFGVQYAPHSRVTLSARLPVIVAETKASRLDAGGEDRFKTDSKGLGDLELRALVPFMRKRNETLQLEFGLTAPTGSIGQRDGGERLSYAQQLGSGTVDLLPGLVYRGHWNSLSWGFVGRTVIRLYQNTRSYRVGNEYMLSPWISQTWTDWLSMSLRMSWHRQDDIHSGDDSLKSPEYQSKRQGGDRIDVGPGVNFRVPFLGGPRFGVEATWPIYQNLSGPQLERDWHLTAGWKWAY